MPLQPQKQLGLPYFIDDSMSDSDMSRPHTHDGGNSSDAGDFYCTSAMAMHVEAGCEKAPE